MAEAPPPRGPRPREHGLRIGRLEPGEHNAITDVRGVTVGHVTVWRDEPDPPNGRGIARTGVTAIVPGAPSTLFAEPIPAGAAVLNGAGELTGFLQVREWGVIQTPVYLTSTMQVGRVLDGAVDAALRADPTVGVDDVVIPIVGECDDSTLNDARVVQVEAADASRALDNATSGAFAEGCVGAGTGMSFGGWKAGIGTSSRALPEAGGTLGVLVLANIAAGPPLRIDGVSMEPLGRGTIEPPRTAGSCVCVAATDVPLRPDQLERVARRCGLGLGRLGSIAYHGSGELFLALSTGARRVRASGVRETLELLPDSAIDELFEAAADATEEAVVNALWAAVDTIGRDGVTVRAIPHDGALGLLERAGRLSL